MQITFPTTLASHVHRISRARPVAIRVGAALVTVAWLGATSVPAGAQPAALPSAQSAVSFDTSGLPNPPTTFEEQRLWDDIATARRYPDLAPQTHLKLAAYYDRRGLSALAAKERAAAGGPATPAPPPAPTALPAAPLAGASSSVTPDAADPTDPNVFELAAFPPTPTTFEEQRIQESLADPHTRTNPVLLAFAHRQLGRYYAAQGRVDLAGTEYARAIVANPTDSRGYTGLAALHEAVDSDAGDGNVALRDVAQRLQDAGYATEGPPEPEPVVTPPASASQWQETSAAFNRRMNTLYTSNAWSNVYRTVFTSLYGT